MFQALHRWSIGARLATLPILFVTGSSLLIGMLVWQNVSQGRSEAAINLAGRQQMLNQRHIREILLASLGDDVDYQKTRSLLVESQKLLRFGGDHSFGEIAKSNSPSVLEALDNSDRELADSVELSNQFLKAVAESRRDCDALRAELMRHTAVAHASAHAVVTALTKASKADRNDGLRFVLLVGIVTTIVGGCWSIFCGKSVSKQVASAAGEIEQASTVELGEVSTRLESAARRTSQQALHASDVASRVSDNADFVANAVTQFEESIKEISTNTSRAAAVARDAVSATEQTAQTITDLSEFSDSIASVVKVIDSVAEQTNFLALNATIEAERAGVAGKGFAVVANEVKELAKQTTAATEDIARRVERIRLSSSDAAEAVATVSGIIAQIDESQCSIASAVEQQTVMTSEISRSVSDLSAGTTEIAGNVSDVAAAAAATNEESERTNATAASIQKRAGELLSLM